MNKNEQTQLDVVVDRAIKQGEARVNAKATELRAKLREERAKLLSQFVTQQSSSKA
jgi:hypothetical protein